MTVADEAKKLIERVIKARERAVAPYSRFAVGCVVLTADGREMAGCNIEVSSYGLTMCAERVAIFKAVSEGWLNIDTVVVVADTPGVCYPCGACRQVIHDFAPDARIICANLRGDFEVFKTSDLLPHAFGSKNLT